MKKYSIAYDSIDGAIEYVELDMNSQYDGAFASSITAEILENIRVRGDFYYRYGDAVHYIMIEKMSVHTERPANVDNVVTFACSSGQTTEEAVEETVEEPMVEAVEEAVEQPMEETVEEAVEQPIEEAASESIPVPAEESELIGEINVEDELNTAINESNATYAPQPESIPEETPERTLDITSTETKHDLNSIVPSSLKGGRGRSRTRRRGKKATASRKSQRKSAAQA